MGVRSSVLFICVVCLSLSTSRARKSNPQSWPRSVVVPPAARPPPRRARRAVGVGWFWMRCASLLISCGHMRVPGLQWGGLDSRSIFYMVCDLEVRSAAARRRRPRRSAAAPAAVVPRRTRRRRAAEGVESAVLTSLAFSVVKVGGLSEGGVGIEFVQRRFILFPMFRSEVGPLHIEDRCTCVSV